jgi:PHD/YefM family antitoxin component YafN of YafNO toxin-antitoxin module
MIRPEDMGSLTDFSRNTKAHLRRLRRTGRPELLTVNGKAEVIIQNASAYQRLIELLEKLKRASPGRVRVKAERAVTRPGARETERGKL